MLYTICFSIVGGIIAHFVCVWFNVSDNNTAGKIRTISGRDMIMTVGIIGGATLGFGYGAARLTLGRYLPF